jgi:broad specificity phosphatase PhoE
MQMKIILVRHGETEENRSKTIQGHTHGTLTEKGVIENARLAELLKSHELHHIYSSDLGRAFETAEQIRMHHPHLEIRPEPLLRERYYAAAQGKTYAECGFDGVPEMTWVPEGGESLEDLLDRSEEFIRLIKERHKDENIMVVTHGLTIMALLSKLLNSEFGDVNKQLPRNSCAKVIEFKGGQIVGLADVEL